MPEARPPSVAPTPAAAPPEAPAEGERVDPLAAEVARTVRELRVAQGLSERAAARLLGTSQTQLRRMEDPRYLPSLRSLARLAAAYGHQLRISFEDKDRAAVRPPSPIKPPQRRPATKPSAPRARAKKRTARTRKRS